MSVQNYPDNILYELDNLEVLRGMNSETVDLIATDPPFNTKRNRSGTAGFYVDNWKWGDTDILPDQWRWNEVHPAWLEQIKDSNRALYEVIEAAGVCHGQDIAAFLCFLSVRLLEMHRVLKPTGSLYLHCDHAANAYIRMCLDAIFGAKNFRNEVVWCYTGPSNTKKWFPRKHDTIFWYGKGKESCFNADEVRVPYSSGLHNTGQVFHKTDGDNSSVREQEKVGKVVEDWWLGYNAGNHISKNERTGSPDQKPIALYERIILASSNEGDLVFDPFAGCATTIMAARQNNRRWVGIDRRPDARFHVVCRMAGITAKDAQDIAARPDLSDWLYRQLDRYDAHYTTKAPIRTDDGGNAPALPQVYARTRPASMRRGEMLDLLTQQWGLVCWGCGFEPPETAYLDLDHVLPASEGGSNELDNRSVLCSPCNKRKSNRLTLTALRGANKKQGRWYGNPKVDQRIVIRLAREWALEFLAKRSQQGSFREVA